MTPPASPYKFLRPYDVEDESLFFGRDQETKVLLADILVSRLVVLFARTGTGKTSLINAGVRPLLHRRGFKTFFIRVSGDAVRSARQVIAEESEAPLARKLSFDRQLERLSRDLGLPLALFFDQFEEFFQSVARTDVDRARRFVSAIARLHANENSRVHLVFSMREEFLGEMDLFRDDIPTIFHADSNLRLRWFAPEQARAAIVEPARSAGVLIEPALERRLVAELAATGTAIGGAAETPIEPAQLQIVCDTLWRRKASSNGRLTVADYRALGKRGRQESVAHQILDQRLEAEFERLKDPRELELAERLLPELRTSSGTKLVRAVDELAATLDTDPDALRALIGQLSASGLVRVLSREGVELVELVHDYLADEQRVEDLRRTVRLVVPRRRLHDALEAGALLTAEGLREVGERIDELDLEPSEGELILRSALGHGLSVEPFLASLERSKTNVWGILGERIAKGDEVEAAAVVESLSLMSRREAVGLLKHALERPELAPRAIALLGRAENRRAVDLLAEVLPRDELRVEVQSALARLTRTPGKPEVEERARRKLREFFGRRLATSAADPERARSAARELGSVEAVVAVELLNDALASADLRSEARDALLELTRSTYPDVASRARKALHASVERALDEGDAGQWAPDFLARIGDRESVELLRRLLDYPALADEADAALRSLLTSENREAAAAAERELSARAGVEAETIAVLRRPAPAKQPRQPAELETHFHLIARRIADKRVVPVLGAGASLADRPHGLSWDVNAPFLPSGRELAEHLAARFLYPTDEPLDLPRVAQYVAATNGTQPLYDELHRVFAEKREPTTTHRALARLPFPAVLVGYDDLMERAFDEVAQPYDVLTYVAYGNDKGKFRHRAPDGRVQVVVSPATYPLPEPERPVILRLYGGPDPVDATAEAYVVTEDDQIDAVLAGVDAIPVEVRARLASSSLLFLGRGLQDWRLRGFVNQLGWEQRMSFKSWAVLLQPGVFDLAYWRTRDVEVLDLDLNEFIEHLSKAASAAAIPV